MRRHCRTQFAKSELAYDMGVEPSIIHAPAVADLAQTVDEEGISNAYLALMIAGVVMILTFHWMEFQCQKVWPSLEHIPYCESRNHRCLWK